MLEEVVNVLVTAEKKLRSLANYNDDGYKNVTYKVNLRECFKLNRAYSISFNSSNVGNCF